MIERIKNPPKDRVVAFPARAAQITPLHEQTFKALVQELWGADLLEDAAQRLTSRVSVTVLERWMRRLVYADQWEEVFSTSFLRAFYTTRIGEVVAGTIEPLLLRRRWALLLEGPRGLTLDEATVLLGCEAPWYADLRFPRRFAQSFRTDGWILVSAVKWQRVIALSDLTFPKILKATLFDNKGKPVQRTRGPRGLF